MRVWKVLDGSLIWDLQGEVSRSAHELFSPDGKYMAEWSSFDLGTYLMDLQTGNYLNNFYANHSDVVTCAAISPDSQLLATGSDDATVQIWSIPGDQQIAIVFQHTKWNRVDLVLERKSRSRHS
jgi:WD40 repeat protein